MSTRHQFLQCLRLIFVLRFSCWFAEFLDGVARGFLECHIRAKFGSVGSIKTLQVEGRLDSFRKLNVVLMGLDEFEQLRLNLIQFAVFPIEHVEYLVRAGVCI